MRIAPELYDEIVAHARREAPNECCGLIASLDGSAVAVHPAVNQAAARCATRSTPVSSTGS